jgi:hypothetical protein
MTGTPMTQAESIWQAEWDKLPDSMHAYERARQAGINALAELYALGLMAEEMGESIQLIGKWLRFGPDHARTTGETARAMLPSELGDVRASIDFALADGLVDRVATDARGKAKLARLLDPESRDDEGRRLAPEPRGAIL